MSGLQTRDTREARTGLDECIEGVRRLFDGSSDRREVHRQAQRIMRQMAADKGVFDEIVRRNIASPGFFRQVRNNPVIGLPIHEEKRFNMIANCWFPHPSRTSDLTHQSIHHHGKLLLTSASAFGEGYESILFKRDYRVDAATGVARLEVDKFYRNPQGNIEFVDSFAPHVVFYPERLSITYVLWSSEDAVATEGLKRIGFLRKHKAMLKKVIHGLGLGGALGLNSVENFDFYVEDGCVRQLKTRLQYGGGTPGNRARNLFHLLQKTGFDDGAFLKRVRSELAGEELQAAGSWLDAWLAQKPIEDEFEPHHHFMDKVTLQRRELLACFSELARAP